MPKFHNTNNEPTRAHGLYMHLAFVLGDVRTHRERLGLSEETRYRVAANTVDALLRDGRWKFLDEVLPVEVKPADHPGDKRR